MERKSKTISAYVMSIFKYIGIFSTGGILLYPLAIFLQVLPYWKQLLTGILKMMENKNTAHLITGINIRLYKLERILKNTIDLKSA